MRFASESVACRIHRLLGTEYPDRNSVSPPQLARDRPVAQVLVPGLVGLRVPLGCEPDFASEQRRLGQARERIRFDVGARDWSGPFALIARQRETDRRPFRFDVPLVAQVRLDRRVRAVRVPDAVLVGLLRLEQPRVAERGHHRLARVLARHADPFLRVATLAIRPPVRAADRRVGRHHIDDREVVPLADLLVVHIVRGGDLQEPRRELRLGVLRGRLGIALHRGGQHDIVVAHDGDHAAHERQFHELADERLRARVARVHRHARIAQIGLGACRRDRDVLRRAAVGHRHLDG